MALLHPSPPVPSAKLHRGRRPLLSPPAPVLPFTAGCRNHYRGHPHGAAAASISLPRSLHSRSPLGERRRYSSLAGPFASDERTPGSGNVGKNPIFKNSWTLGAGVSNMFGLPSRLYRCMASSSPGDGGFARPTSIDEAVSPLPFYSWPYNQRPRVCILGGGFGGLYTALRLESLVWPSDKKPQVLLVDQSDRFVFKPMLYELLSGEVDVWEIAPSFTELLKNTSVQFVRDTVKLLRPSDHFRGEPGESRTGGVVHLESGTVIEYDCQARSSFRS